MLNKKKTLNNKSIPSDVKSYYEFCTFFSLHQLIKAPTRITCNKYFSKLPRKNYSTEHY